MSPTKIVVSYFLSSSWMAQNLIYFDGDSANPNQPLGIVYVSSNHNKPQEYVYLIATPKEIER